MGCGWVYFRSGGRDLLIWHGLALPST
jgi:hypothetical protein